MTVNLHPPLKGLSQINNKFSYVESFLSDIWGGQMSYVSLYRKKLGLIYDLPCVFSCQLLTLLVV